MNDRELLELAAKAIGMPLNPRDGFVYCENVGPNNSWGLWRDVSFATAGNPNPRYVPGCWNPFTDDGDALRLAVKLAIDVQQFVGAAFVEAWSHPYTACAESLGQDPYKATRRAICRMAAEIGKNMP